MTATWGERPKEPGTWKAELEQRFNAFVSAYERGSVEALGELFWHDDDIVVVGTHSNLHFVGWAQVEHSFRAQFGSLSEIRVTPRSEQLWHGGAPPSTMACLTLPAMDIALVAGGRPVTFEGIRVSCAFERRGTEWRMVQMHWSLPRTEVLVDHRYR
ncbi:nuclear transport factor 2 family protein [Corallococcus sp. ZKHCc1 1396]|uniref:Nuclear transport factor 2 family protein n=1 Tax=Corallococcus soli TaxID=2710757 RepID=A0ABR9PHB8_9BACT|nr:nuclear transport factor 2 family protein [Corallococcus soli]MBE4747295.1 nuclear transport factor 2 family protein [Corallococcus soli]